MSKQTTDIYQSITDAIVNAIEAGSVGDWRMPWHHDGSAASVAPVNALTGRPYRGVNILALWAAAEARGYTTGTWGTYRQWLEFGAQVRKGERASLVVLWKVSEAHADDEERQEEDSRTRAIFARGYRVFNADQVDGYTPSALPPKPQVERIAQAEAFFKALPAIIRHGGNRAYYSPARDCIQMPRFEAFPEPVGYYATLAHETTHWSGATPRLNRDLSGRFGSDAYAAEELVAELGAAFLCADLGLSNEPRPDHAAYVANWLKVLREDKRAIFTAASKAQAAADYLHGLQTPADGRQAA